MPTQQQIQTAILSAQYKVAVWVNNNLSAYKAGFKAFHLSKIATATRNINAVVHQYDIGDYSSIGLVSAYDCLVKFIGIDTDNPINPNAQSPGSIFIIEGGGSTSKQYTYSEANLIDSGGGNYYLPFNFDSGNIPVFLTINGVSTAFTFDETFTPPRIYGFANNLTQTIVLTVISTT